MHNGISWHNLGGLIRGYMENSEDDDTVVDGVFKSKHVPKIKKLNAGGEAAAGLVNTGFAPGGNAAQPIADYFSGATTGGAGGANEYNPGQNNPWVQQVQQQATSYDPTTAVPPPTTGGGGGGPAVVSGAGGTGEFGDTWFGDPVVPPSVIPPTVEEETEEVIADRINTNREYVDDVVEKGGGSVAPVVNVLDASQSDDEYNRRFQENFASDQAHAEDNPYGQSTGVPLSQQGFPTGESLLPPPSIAGLDNQVPSFFNPIKGSGTLSEAEVAQHTADRERGGVHYTSSSDQLADNKAGADATAAKNSMIANANASGGNQIKNINSEASLNHEEVRDGLKYGNKPVQLDDGKVYLVNGAGTAVAVNPLVLEQYGVDLSTVATSAPAEPAAAAPQTPTAPLAVAAPAPAAPAAKPLSTVRASRWDTGAVYNPATGGFVQGNNMGGPIMDMEEEEKRRQQSKVARSQLSATPLQPAQQIQGGGGGGQGGGGIGQIAMAILPKLFGLPFNDGGEIPMQQYNKGGKAKEKKKPSIWSRIWGSKTGKPGSIWEQTGRNEGGPIPMGGPLSGNPQGYNEGGPGVGTTPTKRVMDEQKIELDKMSWQKMEERKDMQAGRDEQRKEKAFMEGQQQKAEAHKEAMKMKKAAATTNKGPLGG